jgi:hypothetical protein
VGKANKRSSGIDTRNRALPLLIEVFPMHFIHRKLVASVSVGLLLVSGSTAFAGDCKPLMKQIEPYDRALKQALDDEPEDLPKELNRHAELIRSGETERAMAIDHEIRSGLAGLLKIEAPQPFLKMHAGLIVYYRAGVSVLEAQKQGGAALHDAEIETWTGLKNYYVNLRDLLVAHDCMPGDVEAIEEHYLPTLEAQLEEMRKGKPLPAHY